MMEQLLAFIQSYYIIFICAVLLVILLGILLYRNYNKKKLKNRIAELIVQYNGIKSVPLSFKLNKAIALAKINESVTQDVKICNEDFDLIQGALNQISLVLADTDDALVGGDLKAVRTYLGDLEGMLDKTEEDTKLLDERLNIVLEEEAQLRSRVNEQKDQFRVAKDQVVSNQINLLVNGEIIEKRFSEIEGLFGAFEEWMFVSEFNKSRETLEEIDYGLQGLDQMINNLPDILMELQGILPKLIEEISDSYTKCVQENVYTQHLQVTKIIEMIQANISEDLKAVEAGNLGEVNKNIEESRKSLNMLLQQLEKERHLQQENNLILESVDSRTADIQQIYQESYEIYDKVAERFDFSGIKSVLDGKKPALDKLLNTYQIIQQKINLGDVPASKLSIELKEYQSELNNLYTVVLDIKQTLDGVRSDEDRAQKQLIKLYLIMNEMRVKIQSQHLPSISEECDTDMQRAYSYIETIEKLLAEETLNVTLLNGTLDEAIDYIYKLYNNVNNLVGMAIMVENTIVFGNRYRSTFQDIDSDLSKSELSFRNGEYTEALRIAIQAVEKVHPGSYEQLIKENAADAGN